MKAAETILRGHEETETRLRIKLNAAESKLAEAERTILDQRLIIAKLQAAKDASQRYIDKLEEETKLAHDIINPVADLKKTA